MISPRVSIIIPAYNQAAYLAQAVQSVLDQSYPNCELIIIDDGSTDATREVAAGFDAARIRYVRQENKGLPGARNTGITLAGGEYLAFLDADDAFHPEKLAVQAAHLDQNPDIGLSYASRIEVGGDMQPAWFLRAPAQISLPELVLGFPFTINDLLVRRSWVEKIAGFDESFRLHSEDRDFYLRLALAGCQFARVDRFVAYRRLHTWRMFDQITERIETMGRALETAFSDPRCPPAVLALRDLAYAKVYLTWALQEFFQEEVALAQEHLRRAAQLDPELFNPQGSGGVSHFLHQLVWFSVRDGGEHSVPLGRVCSGLPPEVATHLARLDDQLNGHSGYREWALARGYLIRGLRAVIWGRLEEGEFCIIRASQLGGRLDDQLLSTLSDQLSCYENEYGVEKTERVLHSLTPFLRQVGTDAQLRWLNGYFSINQAFSHYLKGQYARVPASIFRAVLRDPSHLSNRGVISILARSLVGIARSN